MQKIVTQRKHKSLNYLNDKHYSSFLTIFIFDSRIEFKSIQRIFILLEEVSIL